MLPRHESIREQFPFLKKFIYFDAGHYTPYPLRVVEKINEFIKTFTTDYLNLSKFHIYEGRAFRETCAKLLNCESDDIIITSNTTHGINIFANGIQLDPRENNVAMLDSEFPAVVYPWLNQEKLGRAKVFLIPSDKGYVNEAVIKRTLMEYNIKVLTISCVQFLGYRHNIRSISEFCRKRNIHLVVDAMQAAGICPIDVQQMGIDYLCAGNQKWLMSPAGLGFTYISKKYRGFVNPTYVGTANVNYDFDNFLDYKLDFRQSGEAYENSTPNTLGMIGTNEALKYFMELGVENIFNHIIDIQDKLIEKLDKSKYKIESDLSPEHRSNIMIFTHTDSSKNKQIQKSLEEKNIYIALREGLLRVSAHIYNNYEDAEVLAKELNAL
ncbi:MAG: aminotransferase class V-fold PLP-dependent enzyme [Chlorobi bacterium]|nr:aminotransferase class V-fold PLP-dependent enzyme [Chlorobiota bacterium]MCI0716156.1 aminotransferase class V-fold PLP-dependent enzyme [Chlorobiota bacterium]